MLAIRTMLLALTLQALGLAATPTPATAEHADLAARVEQAELQYRIALRTLETAGRDETAAEVRLFRETWQQVIAWLDANRPIESDSADADAATMTQIDALLVGAIIVIDIGSRDAARAALAPIGDVLAELRARAPQR